MKIISRIIEWTLDIFRGSSEDFQPTEQEIGEAEKVANQTFEVEEDSDVIDEVKEGFEADEAIDPEVSEKVEVEEEENSETCEICDKTFSGENAGQKKGGHKASAH